jgi:hypothetical protein
MFLTEEEIRGLTGVHRRQRLRDGPAPNWDA